MANEKGNYKSRSHTILLYPEDPRCEKVLEGIKTYEYAFILHDKDVTETGEIKKPHYHVIVRSKNATWRDALSKEFEYPANYFEQVRSEDAILCYLTHANEEKKHHYELSEVQGSLSLLKRLKKLLERDEVTESEKALEIIKFILDYSGPLDTCELARWCANEERWDVFRRSASIFLQILKEKRQ